MAENTVQNTEESFNEQPQLFKPNRQQHFRKKRWSNRNDNAQQHGPKGENNEENYEESIEGNDSRLSHQKSYVNKIEMSIRNLSSAPTIELPPYDLSERKFSVQNRIYIGNITNDTTEEDLIELFKPFGEITEIFLNKVKSFAFVKMDYHAGAVKACIELDGTSVKGKFIKVKLSHSLTAIKVSNLSPWVTGELLQHAFLPFGEIESAKVLVDEKGRSMGEGIIDFTRKFSVVQAVKKCHEKCYFLGHSIRPVVVEPYECPDQSVGLLDKHISKRNQDFMKERSVGPRLAEPHSFEHEYGTRWKVLYELHRQKLESLKTEFRLECEKLEAQMEYALYEHETESLRAQLKHRELDKERQIREWEMRQRQVEEEKQRSEFHMRQTQKEFHSKMWKNKPPPLMYLKEEPAEDLLLKQAQNLNSILEAQEGAENVPGTSNRDRNQGTSEYNNPECSRNWSRNSNGGNGDGTWVKYESQNHHQKRRRFF
ncbi:hrp65 protein-like [Anthonomus grandis grandis]|uniref:hrp65 protein-like n=1 Tax=Anthonomus grandis grandis TaxID=2921223 RepID=UPI002164F1BE|nr:hrp65 protein-like [Anthonomus grandis grandis]